MTNVLVVDDNRELAENLAELVSLEGHGAVAAFGGEDALRKARRHPFDIALVDLCMPDMDGVELARELTREHPSASYQFVSGYADEELLRDAREFSGSAPWSKPLPIGLLFELLASG